MKELGALKTPALVVDLDKLEANVRSMAERSRRLGVALRPHIKTHKCIEVALLQRAAGCRGLTVSTLQEARVFADHGFEDLTWAFPVILNRLEEVSELAQRVTLGLVLDSLEAAAALESRGLPFRVWLKVDCGYHRAGVDPRGPLAIALGRRLARSGCLRFAGLLTHSGHAYHAEGRETLRQVAEEERAVMVELADRLRGEGIEVPAISVGSTPAMSVVEHLDGVDEARPGNYVYYDRTQIDLGTCRVEDCAATVLASVVSCQPGAGHCVVDAGALALSKDAGLDRDRPPSMGKIFADYDAAILEPEIRLTALSQEHGIVGAPLPVGKRVRILPNHSCLTVACFDEAAVVRGQQVVDHWKVWRGRGDPVQSR